MSRWIGSGWPGAGWLMMIVAATLAAQVIVGVEPVHAEGINPRDIATTDDEAGQQAVRTVDQDGGDERSTWVQLRWEREKENSDFNTGPATIETTVWVANDLASARAIFQEQSARNVEFPEAYYKHDGPFALPISGIGDEVSALSACVDCHVNGDIHLHHRVTLRRGVVVATIYLYGTEITAPQDLMTWYAVQTANRIPNSAVHAPEGIVEEPGSGTPIPNGEPAAYTEPAAHTEATAYSEPAESAMQQSVPTGSALVLTEPKNLAIKIGEAGKNAEVKTEKDGTDERGSWYEVRFERDGTGSRFYQGPVTVHNIVYVTRDIESARQTFHEQVALNEMLPEADRRVGQKFGLTDASGIGDESDGISACERSCNAREEIYVHKRLVSRVANVVSVVYLWGLSHDEGTSDWHARYFADLVVNRARGAIDAPSI